MLLDTVLLVLGGLLLYFGAEWLVSGAAGIARLLGVPPLLIGLTVVSYGTSAPELAVSVVAAVDGQSAIALGNVVGSNIANIGLILGLTALIAPPLVDPVLIRREVPFLGFATLATIPILIDGRVDRGEAGFLLLGALLFTAATIRWSKLEGRAGADNENREARKSKWLLGGLFLLGLVLLVGGGSAFVHGASGLARAFGFSERFVGLTIVAFGTSLPELAASVVAALRGHSDMALGTVVGSNVFNIALILGATSMIAPIEGEFSSIIVDLGVMCGLTVLMALSMFRSRRITRIEGGLYVAIYAGFIVGLVLSS